MTPFTDRAVAAKFDAYPVKARRKMLVLRELLFRTAAATPGVGAAIEETLKWGEPAYLTRNRTGCTVRMDWKARDPENYAMYFNCQTNLVESFRVMFPRDFTFVGNRALVFRLDEEVPQDALAVCIVASLTYHAAKRAAR